MMYGPIRIRRHPVHMQPYIRLGQGYLHACLQDDMQLFVVHLGRLTLARCLDANYI